MDELIFASATELARAIRAREVCSEEVVEAYLERIEKVNTKLNAVVQLTANAARAQAREARALVKHHSSFVRFFGKCPFVNRRWKNGEGYEGRNDYLHTNPEETINC